MIRTSNKQSNQHNIFAEYKIIATDGNEYLIDIDISDKKGIKPQKCIKCEYINDLLRKINQNNDFIKIK